MKKLISVIHRALLFTCVLCPAIIYSQCIPVVGPQPAVDSVGITKFILNTINNTTIERESYADYSSSHITTLARGSYATVFAYSTTYEFQSVRAWADWNQDNDFDDAGEEIAYLDEWIPGQTIALEFYIPPATILGATRIRIASDFMGGILSPCGPQNSGDVEDYGLIINDLPTAVTDFKVSQEVSSCIYPGRMERLVLKVKLIISHLLAPSITLTNFSFNTNGTTNTGDLSNVRFWYTGTIDGLRLTNQFGTTVNSPNGVFNFNDNITLGAGTYYFWLTYDISPGATIGNAVAAEAVSLTANAVVKPPTSIVPYPAQVIYAPTNYPNKHGNMWYFGRNAGLDFNCDPVVPIIDSKMYALEGCSSIADEYGNLLFYTNGRHIWDRSNQVMPNTNGTTYPSDSSTMLYGDLSSVQAALISPVIGEKNRYYLFTTDGQTGVGNVGPKGNNDGLYYTVVDMALNNGFGDIDTAFIHSQGYPGNKIPLIDSTWEKLTALKHANGRDYWILTRRRTAPYNYYAFNVSCSGVNKIPVISAGTDCLGCGFGIFASHDGKAFVDQRNGGSSLYDFDNSTGAIIANSNVNGVVSYVGVFSPDDSLIYFTDGNSISQRNRYTGAANSFPVPSSAGINTAIVGPDNKIYFPGYTPRTSISVLTQPNNAANPGLIEGGISLGGKIAEWGLPNYYYEYLFEYPEDLSMRDSTICSGDSIIIGRDSVKDYTYSWLPAAGLNNPGISRVKISPSNTTTYILSMTDPCGRIAYDTVIISVAHLSISTLGPDTNICEGGSLVLNSGYSTGNNWNNGLAATQIITVTVTGSYFVTVEDQNGCIAVSDTINITMKSLPSASISHENTVCYGGLGTATVIALGGTPPYTYLWSNGTTIQTASLSAGNYSVTITDANFCLTTATVNVIDGAAITVTTSGDVTIISGDTTILSASGGATYQWSPQTGLNCITCATTIARPPSTMQYCVVVTDENGCSESACVTITVETVCEEIFVPNAFSPNNDGQNDWECILGNCIKSLTFKIYDRWGEKVFETTDPKACWDGIYETKKMADAVFIYYLNVELQNYQIVTKRGNISLLR